MELSTQLYLPADEHNIPNGGPIPYPNQDVTSSFTLGHKQPVFNDCFVQNPAPASIPLDTRSEPLKRHLHAFHPTSRLHLEVYSTEPAFQVYTSEYNDVPAVGGAPARGHAAASAASQAATSTVSTYPNGET